MQINNNLNSMIQLEKKLEESASALAKLNSSNSETSERQDSDFSKKEQNVENEISNVNMVDEMVKQIEIPIAYSVNANVISVQNALHQTVLDIKA
ncbi:MAG: flagellar basal body rod C-terminal domain-containing protein [Campylobacterota bacterium]|nr:flagellar basal body rod C-terminal domain-containing protein [Campylobacterota bacterium]